MLQTSGPHNYQLPNLLIIFDGCDTAIHKLLRNSTKSKLDISKHNLPNKIGLEKFTTVKLAFTCREETFQCVTERHIIFEPKSIDKSHELPFAPKLLLQRSVELFSDDQITAYIRKCSYYGLMKAS